MEEYHGMTAREQAAQETTEVEEPEAVQEVTEQDIFPEEEARITGISLMHGS